MAEFEDRVAVVTGGSRGIGKGIARAFAAAGARVVIAAKSQANLDAAAAEIAAIGPPPLAVAGDLGTLAACEALHHAVVSRYGRCDILVNSAGATRAGNFTGLADALWQDGFALKFHGAVRLCRLFWPELGAAGGHVVNIIGGAARTPAPDFLIGSSVNAAFAAFTKGLSKLGIQDGVNVNAIHPGRTDTERTQALMADRAAARNLSIDAVRAEEIASAGVNRLATVEDVAALTLFLCSEPARQIQGTAIAVDGGATPGNH